MTKEDYKIALTNPLWRAKRLAILKRDDYKCTKCSKTTTLHVHHLVYSGEYPWESKNEELITLCKKCHEEIHGIEPKKIVNKIKKNKESFYITDSDLKKQFEGFSKKLYSKFIQHLVKRQLIYWMRGRIDGKLQVFYMDKARTSKTQETFRNTIFRMFQRFKEDNPKLLN